MNINLIVGLIFLCLAITSVILKKVYFELPAKEFKKRRSLGYQIPDDIVFGLNHTKALRSLLDILLVLSMAVSLSLLSRATALWLTLIITILEIYLIFFYLPSLKVHYLDRRITMLAAPLVNWKLRHFSKQLELVYSLATKHNQKTDIDIYDEQDLNDLFKQLSKNPDNRLNPDILTRLEHSLLFYNKRIKDLMIAAKKLKLVDKDDVIGPILINELHQSNEGYALVKDGDEDNIIGLLMFNDLSIHSQGRVDSHKRSEVEFVHQDDSPLMVIQGFYETQATVFIVVNDNQKFVGSISLADVLKVLIEPQTINQKSTSQKT